MSDVKLYTRRDMARLTALGAAGLAVKKSLAVSSSEHSQRARGMLLAAQSFYIGGAKWENPYSTDGLVAMWDVEAVPPSGSLWKPIVGTVPWMLVGASVSDQGVTFAGGSSASYGYMTPEQSKLVFGESEFDELTLGACFRLNGIPSENGGRGGVLLKTHSSNRLAFMLASPSNANVTTSNVSTTMWTKSYNPGWSRYVGDTISIVFSKTDHVNKNAVYNGENLGWSTSRDNVGGSQGFATLGQRMTLTYGANVTFFSIRLYNRALSIDEMKANSNTDKTRFGIA